MVLNTTLAPSVALYQHYLSPCLHPPVRPITLDGVEDPSVQLAAPSTHQPVNTGKKKKSTTVMLGIIRGNSYNL